MEQSWRQASKSFARGRVSHADVEFEKVRRALPTASSCSSLSTVVAVNTSAIAIELACRPEATEKNNGSVSASVVASAESVAASACVAAARISNGGLEDSILISETALIACYNAALVSLRSCSLPRAREIVRLGIAEALRSSTLFAEEMEQSSVEAGPAHKKRRKPNLYIAGANHANDSPREWQAIRAACEKLRLTVASHNLDKQRQALHRWALAGGALFELTGAISVMANHSVLALDAGHVASGFTALGALLIVVSTGTSFCRESLERGERTSNVERYDDSSGIDGCEDSDRNVRDDSTLQSSLCEKADEEHLRKRQHILSQPDDYFLSGMRGRFMSAIAYGLLDDWDNAIASIRNDALTMLQHTRREADLDIFASECCWPSAYIAGALLLRRGEDRDQGTAVALLEGCALAGYRPADAMALAARHSTGEVALQRWHRVMAIDHIRPGGLWSACRVFAELGQHEARANLLACLEDLLAHDETRKAQQHDRMGVVSLAPPLMYETSKGGIVCAADLRQLPGSNESVKSFAGLSMPRLRLERARALAASEDRSAALEILKTDAQRIINDDAGILVDPYYHSDLLRDYAWTLAYDEASDEALLLADNAVAVAATETAKCAALLCKADALLNQERVKDALEMLMQAFRIVNPAVYTAATKEISSSKSQHCTLQWDAMELYATDDDINCFLRGLCYNNIGVLQACVGDYLEADRSFVGAQVAFDKSTTYGDKAGCWEKVTQCAEQHGNAAVFNRCLLMYRRGQASEAASMWLGRVEHPISSSSDTKNGHPDSAPKFGDAEAVASAATRASMTASNIKADEQVGAAHVLGYLSNAQSDAMTFVCMARLHAAKLRATLGAELSRASRSVL